MKRLKTPFKVVFEAFANFIYPSQCPHCALPISFNQGYFCKTCVKQLELIDPKERCIYCFSSDYDVERRFCYSCFMDPPVLKRYGAVFDYQGPAATLVLKMKHANQPYLTRGAGAYLALQFMRLGWPLPDFLVPVPLTLAHQISRGYNQSLLLAVEMGKILKRPVQNILKRKGLEVIHQKGEKNSFLLKGHIDIRDKTLLLIDDFMMTGQTMNHCAEILYEGFPKAVYGLTVCRN